MNSRISDTTVIRRVAIYVLDEHPEARLAELRKIAADHHWQVSAEYVESQPGESFRALQEADHVKAHDATLSWVGDGGPRLTLNQHGRVSG